MGRYTRFDVFSLFGLSLASFAAVFVTLDYAQTPAAAGAVARVAAAVPSSAYFGICEGSVRIDCVVDGDTIWMAGQKIRLLDIDTPELHPARCDYEQRLGLAAKARLRVLLNSGTVSLERGGSRDRDRYGRLLRTVSVDGDPVGDRLIAEGLARPYGNGRRSWCG